MISVPRQAPLQTYLPTVSYKKATATIGAAVKVT